MKRRKSRRRSSSRGRKVSYNRRKHSRKARRNAGGGKYSSFVKKHKGLYKRLGFARASKRIAAMWRSKH